MTPIETMALLVVLLGLIKLAVILSSPQKWMLVARAFYSRPKFTTAFSVALIAISLYLLLAELTIIQIFASMVFFMGLMLMGFSAYSKEMLALSQKMLKDKNSPKKAWLSIVVWLALSVWVLYGILF